MRDSVFISYSHRDAKWLQRLQVHFAPFERRGKIQHWDDTMIAAGSKWRDQISRALDSAKVAVLLVSADFLASEFIANEELPRLFAAAENDGVAIIPVIVGPCAFDSFESLCQFQSINSPAQPLSGLNKTKREQTLVRLAAAVSLLLAPQAATKDAAPSESGRLCNVPARNPLFCGREELVSRITHEFSACRAQSLCGIAGIGKTETAIEYIYRNRQNYSVVIWVRADSRQQLHSSYIEAAKFLGLPEWHGADQNLTVVAVRRWLARNSEWLLVADDVGDIELIKEFLPENETGQLLITTRMQATSAIARPLEVEPLDDDDAATLLLRRARILSSAADLRSLAPSDYAAARAVACELQGLPMALDQAGAYLEETGTNIDDYRALWLTHRAKLLAQAPMSSLRNSESVAKTWSLSFAELTKNKPVAVDLLKLLAYMHPDAISEDVLRDGSSALKADLALVLGDPWEINNVVREAIKLSLLRRDAKSRALRMHRLLQVVLRDSMETGEQLLWKEQAVRLLDHVFPAAKFVNWDRCEKLLAHVQVCAEAFSNQGQEPASLGRLLHDAGYYLYQRGRYREAAVWIKRALAIRAASYGKQHEDYARTLLVHGQFLQATGNLSEAEQILQSAIEVLRGVLGPENDEVARALGCLAALKLEQGALEEAQTLFQNALAAAETVLGAEHADVAQLVNNLAAVHFQRGVYPEAESLFARALAIREKVLPAAHPSIAQGYNNLAAACARQDRFAEAANYYQKALAMREGALGAEHPHVADTVYSMALLCLKQRDPSSAENFLNRALLIYEKTLDAGHPSIGNVLQSLGEVRLVQDAVAEAAVLFGRALSIHQATLGDEHPYVGYDLIGLAEVHMRQGDHEKADGLLRQAARVLEKGLGPAHPDVLGCRVKIDHLAQRNNS